MSKQPKLFGKPYWPAPYFKSSNCSYENLLNKLWQNKLNNYGFKNDAIDSDWVDNKDMRESFSDS